MARSRTSSMIRLDPDVWERLKAATAEHGFTSVTWLANKGLRDFLAHLLPPEEVQWTRRRADA